MKKMFKYLTLTLPLVIFFACNDQEREFVQKNATNGAYIKFTNSKNFPSDKYSGLLSAYSFSGQVEAPSNNVASYKLYIALGDDEPTETTITLTSFPSTLTIKGSDILSALNKTDADFYDGSTITFYGEVTSTSGIVNKDFPNDSNVSGDLLSWIEGTFSAYKFFLNVDNLRVKVNTLEVSKARIKENDTTTITAKFDHTLKKSPVFTLQDTLGINLTVGKLLSPKASEDNTEYSVKYVASTGDEAFVVVITDAESTDAIPMAQYRQTKKNEDDKEIGISLFTVDNTVPTVSSQELEYVVDNGKVSSVTVKFTFSEDVVPGGDESDIFNFSVTSANFDDVTISYKKVILSDKTVATIIIPLSSGNDDSLPISSFLGSSFSIAITGGEDLAGNKINDTITITP